MQMQVAAQIQQKQIWWEWRNFGQTKDGSQGSRPGSWWPQFVSCFQRVPGTRHRSIQGKYSSALSLPSLLTPVDLKC